MSQWDLTRRQVSQWHPEDTREEPREVDPDPHRTNVHTETAGRRTNGSAATQRPGNGQADSAVAKQKGGAKQGMIVREAYEQFCDAAKVVNLRPPPPFTPGLAGKIADTLQALGGPHGGLNRWQDMLEKVERTPFLTGRSADASGGYFRAQLGWLCKPGTAATVLAGAYDPYPHSGSET